jgi:alpha-tubulin suppressor-like RCC1 family protein
LALNLGSVIAMAMSITSPDSCAIVGTDRRLWCWGSNKYGQRGVDAGSLSSASEVPNVSQVREVASGYVANCAKLNDRSVACAGSNGGGAFGDGDAGGGSNVFEKTIPAGVVSGISMRSSHACALSGSAPVVCWGTNVYGEIGNGEYAANAPTPCSCVPSPSPVVGIDPGVSIVEVSAGAEFSVAVDSTGAVWAWGINGAGQLGHAPDSDAGDIADCHGGMPCNPIPQRVPGFPVSGP